MAKFFRIPWALSGDKTTISDDLNADGTVSYEQGYTADYSLDLSTEPDARPVERRTFNQALNDVTTALRQYQEFSVPDFITSAENDGVAFTYSKGARVRYDAGSGVDVYVSLIDSNTDLPTVTSSWALASTTQAATETVAGIAEIATNAETITGTDNTRIVTPAKLRYGFAYSFGQNGYIALPSWLGGFVVQWGTFTGTTGATISFPITYPNSSYAVVITHGPSAGGLAYASVHKLSNSNFVVNVSSEGKTYQFISVGC